MNSLIASFDVKDYSQIKKSSEKKLIRETIYKKIVDSNMNLLKLKEEDIIDTGDGFYLILDTTHYDQIIKLFNEFSNELKVSNVQIRASLHLGSVEDDNSFNKKGKVGIGIDESARYLENEYIKQVLVLNENVKFTYGISDKVFESIKNESWFLETNYCKYDFTVKKFNGVFYLYKQNIEILPDQKQKKVIYKNKVELKKTFSEFLYKSDFPYMNNAKENSNLQTFFVFPELNVIDSSLDESEKIKSDKVLVDFIDNPKNIIFYGEDQSGKTSLAKVFYKKVLDTELLLPIYIKFSLKEKGFLSNKIKDRIKMQYNLFDETLPRVLILDDFHLLEEYMQEKIFNEFSSLENTFVIIFVDNIYGEALNHINRFKKFSSYSIRRLGHLKRKEIIEKWLNFNNIENKNYEKIDELEDYVNQTLLNGMIPYSPFYVLTILSVKKDLKTLDPEITSKGQCYQSLIERSFKQIGITDSSKIGSVMNLLGFIAFDMFNERKADYSDSELKEIFIKFGTIFNCTYNFDDFLKLLNKNPIFSKNSLNLYSFNGKYFYYYFVARYIAARITQNNFYQLTKNLIEHLYISENAYIVIFIIHHTRNLILFDEIQLNAMLCYEDDDLLNADEKDTKKINNIFDNIKNLCFEDKDNSVENRIENAKVQDSLELENQEQIEKSLDEISENPVNNEFQILRKTLKTVEVLGHILKNHNGEIEKTKIMECFINGVNALRRMGKHLIVEISNNENDLIELIINHIDEKQENQKLTKFEKEKIANQFMSLLYFSVINTVILLCGNLLGAKDVMAFVKQMYDEDHTPIMFCIYLYCSLWYNKQPPLNELKSNFNNLPIAIQNVVRIIVKNFVDVHKIEYKDKQKLANIIGIKVNKLKIDYSK